jgi:hypothetical protein
MIALGEDGLDLNKSQPTAPRAAPKHIAQDCFMTSNA